MPWNPAGPAHQANELPGGLAFCSLRQRRLADEVTRLVELDNPSQASIKRGHVAAKLVAVQRHPRFKPQRIPGGQASRDQLRAASSLSQGMPDPHSLLWRNEDLES